MSQDSIVNGPGFSIYGVRVFKREGKSSRKAKIGESTVSAFSKGMFGSFFKSLSGNASLVLLFLLFSIIVGVVASCTVDTTETKPQTIPENEQIEKIATSALSGGSKVRDVKATTRADGGWNVDISYNSGSTLKIGIEVQMSKIYTALYASNRDIKDVTVSAYLRVVDRYGNEQDAVVYETNLKNDVAKKINWQTDEDRLQQKILPGLWTTIKVNPTLD